MNNIFLSLKKRRAASIAVFFSAFLVDIAHAAPDAGAYGCGPLENGYGPFDYRTDKEKLPIVEHRHFTRDVESGKSGSTSTDAGGDLDYTLRAFPNHHRALRAMMALGERLKTEKPPRANYSVACYFERALRFKDNDPTVHMLYGMYLNKKGKTKDALAELERASELGEDSGNFHYNMGLMFADMKQWDKSLEHAQMAYRMGFDLPGLREKLKKAGKWVPPPPLPPMDEPAKDANKGVNKDASKEATTKETSETPAAAAPAPAAPQPGN